MDKEYEYAPSSKLEQANWADMLDAQTANEDVYREDVEDSKGPEHVQIGAVFDHTVTLVATTGCIFWFAATSQA